MLLKKIFITKNKPFNFINYQPLFTFLTHNVLEKSFCVENSSFDVKSYVISKRCNFRNRTRALPSPQSKMREAKQNTTQCRRATTDVQFSTEVFQWFCHLTMIPTLFHDYTYLVCHTRRYECTFLFYMCAPRLCASLVYILKRKFSMKCIYRITIIIFMECLIVTCFIITINPLIL